MFTISCPECRSDIEVHLSDEEVKCKVCGKEFTVYVETDDEGKLTYDLLPA